MKELSEKASVAEVSQHLPVAQEILAQTDAAHVVAFLLKNYFHQASSASERRPPRQQQAATEPVAAEANGEQGARRRRRRRSRRRGRGGEGRENGTIDSMDVMDATEAASVERLAATQVTNDNTDVRDPEVAAPAPAPVETSSPNGMTRLRVNIGFDDGFKGRGAVAKKISALAGLNDGIISELESRRDHAVLLVTSEIAELVIDRVDGAQIGKKILAVSAVS